MEYVSRTTEFLDKQVVQRVLSNVYIMSILKITLALYAVQIAPTAPEFLQNIFKNTYAKIILIFLIIYLSEHDFQLAILLSVIYVLAMNLLAGRGILESYADFDPGMYNWNADGSRGKEINAKFTLIEPKTMIYPGCQDITMEQLYQAFGGDVNKLTQTTQYAFRELLSKLKTKDSKESLTKIAYAAGLPYNMSFDKKETAPYIATLLVNYGFIISDTCQPPY